jgi:hypothetical protein
MLPRTLRTNTALISGALLLIGFALMATRYLPAGIAGAGLIVLAFIVPFTRLSPSAIAEERRGSVASTSGSSNLYIHDDANRRKSFRSEREAASIGIIASSGSWFASEVPGRAA